MGGVGALAGAVCSACERGFSFSAAGAGSRVGSVCLDRNRVRPVGTLSTSIHVVSSKVQRLNSIFWKSRDSAIRYELMFNSLIFIFQHVSDSGDSVVYITFVIGILQYKLAFR